MLEHSKAKDLQMDNGRLDDALKKLGSCNQKDEQQYREIIKLLLECKKLNEKPLPTWDVKMVSKHDADLIQVLCEKGFFNKQHLQHAIEKHVDHEVLLLLQKYLK